MIHFLPDSESRPEAQDDALARRAGMQRALALVETVPGEMAERARRAACAWKEADQARRRRFASRSEREASAVAAGLEALLHAGEAEQARRVLAEEMGERLDQLGKVLRG